MDYDIETDEILEMTANYWRPVDYEVLDIRGKFTAWHYWCPLFYTIFLAQHNSVRWN